MSTYAGALTRERRAAQSKPFFGIVGYIRVTVEEEPSGHFRAVIWGSQNHAPIFHTEVFTTEQEAKEV